MIDALTNEINRGLQYVQIRLKSGESAAKDCRCSFLTLYPSSFGPSDQEHAQNSRILHAEDTTERGGQEADGSRAVL